MMYLSLEQPTEYTWTALTNILPIVRRCPRIRSRRRVHTWVPASTSLPVSVNTVVSPGVVWIYCIRFFPKPFSQEGLALWLWDGLSCCCWLFSAKESLDLACEASAGRWLSGVCVVAMEDLIHESPEFSLRRWLWLLTEQSSRKPSQPLWFFLFLPNDPGSNHSQ